MRIPPLPKKKIPGAAATAPGMGTQTNRVRPDYPSIFFKLATIAALFLVELAGGTAVIAFWMWRAGHV